MNESDLELLKRYGRDRSEEAFAELVRRHLDLVHSAALRQVRSPQLAEEVAQSAFTDLARQAHRLAPDTILTAWLYQVTRRTAIDVVRREARRQLREQIATEMNALNATAADWTHIEPLLDDAMSALDETDRAAVLLRYFENKSLREVGQTLGTSDDAAQKRVSRAVVRLREFFAKRGVNVGASGLAVVISANAVQAAPVGLAVTISTAAALAGTTIVATAAEAVAMTTIQKALLTATLAAAVGTALYQARRASIARADLRSIQQEQQAALTDAEKLRTENQQLAARLRAQTGEVDALRKGQTELLQLRGQVGVLRQQLADTTGKLARPDAGANGLARSWTLGSVKWLAEWKDAGLTSPEAALETYWWAIASGNVEKLQQCMVFDRGVASEPVSQLYAKREARSESYPLKSGTIGGIRLYSFSQSSDANHWPPLERAKAEVELIRRVREEDGLPAAPDGSPTWTAGQKRTLELMKAGDEWKVSGYENSVKMSLDDEDSEAVAKMMMQMDPKTLEELKGEPRIPLRTWQAYEDLRAKAAK
jgi:RNA polymerase sigma factor (sigma-70 family)